MRYVTKPSVLEQAANSARINSLSSHEQNFEAVESLLHESKFFIEWTAIDMDVNTAAELVAALGMKLNVKQQEKSDLRF
ncbi:MAG: hypothetical protein ACE5K8_04250 [Candidatus Zixiibacteriota bacterium]